tara:strand:+ start:182 stop:1774 length:1593 start_codon:yes stop_codon:yes gene_type:complete
MAKLLKLRRGTTSQHSSFTGAEGEVTVNTDNDSLVVHDGSTAGGHELLRKDLSNAPAGVIDNADISSSANIAGTKISPNFGSQNITTTGTLASNDLTITGGQPSLKLIDDANNPDYNIYNNNGLLKIYDITNAADRLIIQGDGTVDVQGNLDANNGLDVTGQITATSHIDLPDAAEIKLGDSDELSISHAANGHSYILENGSGDLNIHATHIKLKDISGNSKFETHSTGASVTGELDVSGNIDLNSDSHRVKLGAGDDFQLYHDGSNNYITTNNGDIIMQTTGDDIQLLAQDDIILKVQGGTENAILCTGDGDVELYNDGGLRFQTSSEGIDVGSTQFTGTRNSNIEHEVAKFAASGTQGNNYLDNHVVTIGQTNGNWNAGATGDSDTSYGLMWHYAASATGTRQLRAGIHYDHANTEQLKIWSSYGSIAFYTDTANSGDKTAEECNVKCAEFDGNGHFVPGTDNERDLGTSSLRWRNVYTTDLHLSNEGHTNDVDGTWGNWTLQEGEDQIFMLNNRSGKKYKINLTEVS